MLLTGSTLSAEEAHRYGLVRYLTDDGEALDRARELAERIARNGPVAVQAVLRALRETECLPEKEALPIEARIGMRVFMSEDAKEGPRAFAEKRRPDFKGK
jgi:enoyl-CoA hydratase